MRNLEFYSLVIEVTKRCNMNCRHCLRGNAQDKDMDFHTILPLLERTRAVSTLSFTGGEPTLNVKIMEEILDYCKSHDTIDSSEIAFELRLESYEVNEILEELKNENMIDDWE